MFITTHYLWSAENYPADCSIKRWVKASAAVPDLVWKADPNVVIAEGGWIEQVNSPPLALAPSVPCPCRGAETVRAQK